MTLQIPITFLATCPVEAANKLLERDVEPMYNAVCAAIERVVAVNVSATPRSLRSSANITEGRMWFGSEQYLINYATALWERLHVLRPATLIKHTNTIPASLQERTNKPPSWLMFDVTRNAHITKLLRYDDMIRLDARLDYLVRERPASERESRIPENSIHWINRFARQREASNNETPLIMFALSHWVGLYDYLDLTMRQMRDFIRQMGCYSQPPSAFFRRNSYTPITGLAYRTYYAVTLKRVSSVSMRRYETLLAARREKLRQESITSVRPVQEIQVQAEDRVHRIPNSTYYIDMDGRSRRAQQTLGTLWLAQQQRSMEEDIVRRVTDAETSPLEEIHRRLSQSVTVRPRGGTAPANPVPPVRGGTADGIIMDETTPIPVQGDFYHSDLARQYNADLYRQEYDANWRQEQMMRPVDPEMPDLEY